MQEFKRLKCFEKGLFTGLMDTAIKPIRDKALNSTQAEEARKLGLTLICRTTDPNYNYYYKESCGHHLILQPTHVRRNNFKCNTCFHTQLVKEAHSRGFQYLFADGNNYKRYIKPCGHIISATPSAVLNSQAVRCVDCFEEELVIIAKQNGYIYSTVDNDRHGIKRKITFEKCGHTKLCVTSQILKGNVVCRQCIEDEYRLKSSNYSLQYLKSDSKRYNWYKLPCGHDKRIRVDHAAEGLYLCHECGDSHYTKPSKIYLFKFDTGEFSWLKLGFAKNLHIRKHGYGLAEDTHFELLAEIDLPTGYDAMLAEKMLHRKFKEDRLNKHIMQKYHKNGYTECYPVSLQNELLLAMKGICNE